MKYMDIPQLNQLSRLLSYESSECNVYTRIEAYSMKPVTRDKKLWKALEKGYAEDQVDVNMALFGKEGSTERDRSQSIDILPPRRSSSFTNYRSPSFQSSPADSSLLRRSELSPPEHGTDNENEEGAVFRLPGELDKSERKILFTLKSTLNAAFPHHDFSALGADQFTKERNGTAVLSSLSNTFRSVGVLPSSSSPSEGNGSRGAGAGGRGRGGGSGVGLSRATTYSAYPSEGNLSMPKSVPTRSEGMDVLRELEQRQAGGYEPELLKATHPVLFGVLDDAIGLKQDQCEVYVWTPPNSETDPHGGGGDTDSGGEWPEGSSEEEDGDESGDEIYIDGSETESEEDSDERRRPFFYPGGLSIRKPPNGRGTGRFPGGGSNLLRQTGSLPTGAGVHNQPQRQQQQGRQHSRQRYHSRSPTRNRLRLRGSLLWSNHWFLVNRKLKRVLFISIWAKSRGYGFSPSSSNNVGPSSSMPPNKQNGAIKHLVGSERFVGWQGAQGTGARAFAARKTGSSLF
ncbi:hypothetical protein M408DRAFT_325936 [Serendipita vermifera MAFF 305830]|uniref:Uncharacterized protein n=1 Tax=Serendipita vermifera MAFF 305830 TaxID=933852 RepID=A0A0C2X4U2_SERVB|nr:hypothetical protein M408DRAFT_325936 [Serendipita vermifera MAFF 305830]